MQQTVSDRWMVTTSGMLQWAIRIQAPSRRRLSGLGRLPLGYLLITGDQWGRFNEQMVVGCLSTA